MSETNFEKPTRRTVLQQITGVAAGAAFPILGQNPPPESHHSSLPVTKEAVTPYRYRYFKRKQLATLDALCETILPADDHSPGAKAAAVSEYIDTIVADESPTKKQLWDKGLALVNRMAKKKAHSTYAACPASEQIAILQEMAGDEEENETLARTFFLALKRATIDGYYTSKIGIHQDLQYQGNDALAAFPGCQHGEHA